MEPHEQFVLCAGITHTGFAPTCLADWVVGVIARQREQGNWSATNRAERT